MPAYASKRAPQPRAAKSEAATTSTPDDDRAARIASGEATGHAATAAIHRSRRPARYSPVGRFSLKARRRVRVIAGCLATAMLTAVLGAPPANAFGRHDHLTTYGLSNSPRGVSFLRPAVLQAIHRQNNWVDANTLGRKGHDEKHFDDCEFDGGARYIREQYAGIPAALKGLRLFDQIPTSSRPSTGPSGSPTSEPASNGYGAATLFGRLLHPAQDFYSHSNWVELGFPLGDVESTDRVEVHQSDLVDLSGAQSSLAQQWYAPPNWGAVVRHDPLRGDILLDYDDEDFTSWEIETGPNIGSSFVPVVRDNELGPNGPVIRGRLLISGYSWIVKRLSWAENECNVEVINSRSDYEYEGPSHDCLNKDGPTSSDCVDDQVQLEKYRKAYALAALQTGYEWCRLVREAHLVGRDGLLLAMWVRAGGNPHPAETPCRPEGRGPTPVTVTVDSIQVLDSGDGPGDPGEIQLAAVLYDDPENFHRSVHVTNRKGGRMSLRARDFVPTDQLPAPMTLCVSRDHGATFTLHAWDNDQPSDAKFGLDFDSEDTMLAGFRREFGSLLPTGPQVAESEDLRVTFRVTRTAGMGTDRGQIGRSGQTQTLCGDPLAKPTR
jgi:hypothetical protein